MGKKNSQSRSWLITQSADKITFEELLAALDGYVYIGQKEKGKQGGEQGFEHYQIYIENPTSIYFATLKNKLPTAHIEMRKGTRKEAFEYVTKSDTKIGEVFGQGDIDITDEKGKRNDMAEIMQMIEDGATDDEIRKAFPTQFLRYANSIARARQVITETLYQNTFRTLTTTYIYGSAGKGKTRYVMEKYGYVNVFRVTDYKHPFDMYRGQKVIIFEEFRSYLKIEQMLNYLDGYPLTLPARYADKVACFDTVYIISNIPLESQYTNMQTEQPETFKALLRRIHFVWDYDRHKEPQPRIQVQAQSSFANLIPIEDDGTLPF
ncbi:MAG: RNA helicase domain-containing protein [Firmicutes bacterium]|nr:RNA helicase domain-containing protein [Bacillota bacterium]